MPKKGEDLMQHLRDTVVNAKSVPMSSSCMINRTELLKLIDDVQEAFTSGVLEAELVNTTSLETLEKAKHKADEIMRQAEKRARMLAEETEIVRRAKQLSVELKHRTRAEATALQRETDAFIDQRMATFEAALMSTLTQISTMREKLSDRSGLDDGEVQALPNLGD